MNEDQLEAALASLPERDVDPWRAEQVRLRARRALSDPQPARHHVETAALFLVCAAQLFWAFREAASILLH